MNLQGFMKQPRINGRQAKWLIYLTPYDFIIRHRPGLLNPADGPSRRPDYLAQKGLNPAQDNLLTSRLVGSYSDRPEAAKCQDIAVQMPLQDAVKCQDIAELLLCVIAKCQLCKVAKKAMQSTPEGTEARLDFSTQLCDITARSAIGSRPALNTTMAGFKLLRADGTDDEASHLIDVVRLQVVTRGQAKEAARDENPLSEETAATPGLLDLILKS